MREFSVWFQIYLSLLVFFLGAALGSFLDCYAERRSRGESVLRGRSHCDSCGHVLQLPDLIPIFSFLWLKGKCRYCGKRVSPECLYTEFTLGFAFLLLFFRFGLSFVTLRYCMLSAILLAVSVIDLKSYTIPDSLILWGIGSFLVTAPLVSGGLGQLGDYQDSFPAYLSRTPETLSAELLYGFAGGILVYLFLLVISLVFDRVSGKEGMGGGDLKLFFVAGLFLKPAVVLFTLVLSCLLGLLFARVWKQEKIPFGPAISMALYLSLLFGSEAVHWYIGLL